MGDRELHLGPFNYWGVKCINKIEVDHGMSTLVVVFFAPIIAPIIVLVFGATPCMNRWLQFETTGRIGQHEYLGCASDRARGDLGSGTVRGKMSA